MDTEELELIKHIDKCLSTVKNKHPRILRKIIDKNISFNDLLISNRKGALLEVLELSYIRDEALKTGPDIVSHIDITPDIGSIDLTEENLHFSHKKIASLIGALTTYPLYSKARFHGEIITKLIFKSTSDYFLKDKSLLRILLSIPEELIKEGIKKYNKDKVEKKTPIHYLRHQIN